MRADSGDDQSEKQSVDTYFQIDGRGPEEEDTTNELSRPDPGSTRGVDIEALNSRPSVSPTTECMNEANFDANEKSVEGTSLYFKLFTLNSLPNVFCKK